MVPSSLVARRGVKKPERGPRPPPASTAPGFGLVPQEVSRNAKPKEENGLDSTLKGQEKGEQAASDSYESFMETMRELGAV